MGDTQEQKRRGRTAAIILGAGLAVFVPLAIIANNMLKSAEARARVAANESAAVDTVDLIAAAEQIYLDAFGSYGTLAQLKDAGILNVAFAGDPPAFKGYVFTVRLGPSSPTERGAFSVNADPLDAEGGDATGRRHFYLDSVITGIRFSEGRPAAAGDRLLPRRAADY